MIVVDVGEGPIVVVTPEITAAEGKQVGLEGCLSLPDLVGEARRAEWVVVKGLNRRGKPVTVEGEGLLACALQHEVDHLDGALFVDCGGCGHEWCYDMAREIVAGIRTCQQPGRAAPRAISL